MRDVYACVMRFFALVPYAILTTQAAALSAQAGASAEQAADAITADGIALWSAVGILAVQGLAGSAPTRAGDVRAENTPLPIAGAVLVFDGVTVVDVQTGKLVPGQRVVIDGNRIRAVGSSRAVKLPKGAQVVDARGKYLIPGLWDLHVHPMRLAPLFYPLFIANGVTGIRDAGSEVPIDTMLLWRREILASTRIGPPRQLLSGQSIAGPWSECDRSKTTHLPETCVRDEADARHFVDSLKAAGADMIKPRAVSRELYFAIADEARRQHIPFGGHAREETPTEIADSGAIILDHTSEMSYQGVGGLCLGTSATLDQCRLAADRMRQTGTWLVPTMVAERNGNARGIASVALAKRFAQRAGEFWSGSPLHGNWLRDSATNQGARSAVTDAAEDGTLRIMQQVGLPILAGSDAAAVPIDTGLMSDDRPMGFALHVELAMYVAEGLTPLHALQSATLDPARMWHATDSLGAVAAGKLADLVLLDENPLADITNTTTIRAVVANGRYFDRVALDKLMADVRSGYLGRGRSP